jgi:hypothetical protein
MYSVVSKRLPNFMCSDIFSLHHKQNFDILVAVRNTAYVHLSCAVLKFPT